MGEPADQRHDGDHAGFGDRPGQRLGFVHSGRQCFSRMNVLAGPDRLHRQSGLNVRRHRERDGVDIGDQLSRVTRDVRAVAVGDRRCGLPDAVPQRTRAAHWMVGEHGACTRFAHPPAPISPTRSWFSTRRFIDAGG